MMATGETRGIARAEVFASPDALIQAAGDEFIRCAVEAIRVSGRFVVALAGAIEEWDPQSRLPKRRLKLPRPAQITRVGGSDRVVWMTTEQDPARIDVIPLVNRGQTKVHELAEPIGHVASHPRSDLIACIGATSGRVYRYDFDDTNVPAGAQPLLEHLTAAATSRRLGGEAGA